MPLPFGHHHNNLWLLGDVQNAVDGAATIKLCRGNGLNDGGWEPQVGTVLDKRPLARIFASRWHLGHIGPSGRLWMRFNAPFINSAATCVFAHDASMI